MSQRKDLRCRAQFDLQNLLCTLPLMPIKQKQ